MVMVMVMVIVMECRWHGLIRCAFIHAAETRIESKALCTGYCRDETLRSANTKPLYSELLCCFCPPIHQLAQRSYRYETLTKTT